MGNEELAHTLFGCYLRAQDNQKAQGLAMKMHKQPRGKLHTSLSPAPRCGPAQSRWRQQPPPRRFSAQVLWWGVQVSAIRLLGDHVHAAPDACRATCRICWDAAAKRRHANHCDQATRLGGGAHRALQRPTPRTARTRRPSPCRPCSSGVATRASCCTSRRLAPSIERSHVRRVLPISSRHGAQVRLYLEVLHRQKAAEAALAVLQKHGALMQEAEERLSVEAGLQVRHDLSIWLASGVMSLPPPRPLTRTPVGAGRSLWADGTPRALCGRRCSPSMQPMTGTRTVATCAVRSPRAPATLTLWLRRRVLRSN